jgi:Type VI immunity for VRR-NUC
MAVPLPIRLRADDGTLALRDGLIFVLFIRRPHLDICEDVARLYSEYEAFVGREHLQWVHARGEQFRPYTPRARSQIARYLRRATTATSELFTIKGDCAESEPGGFLFRYRGRDLEGRLAEVNASFAEMWFPSDFPSAVGWEKFVDALLRLAELVPFISGYCSLALNREDWAVVPTEDFVRAAATRHPGLDLHDTMNTAIRIGDSARGAYWLSLLSPVLLGKLQLSLADLRRELGPEIMVHELANGVAIQADAEPRAGDRNRRDNLPRIRRVAEVIAPIQHIQEIGIFGFEELDEFIDWQKRHLL